MPTGLSAQEATVISQVGAPEAKLVWKQACLDHRVQYESIYLHEFVYCEQASVFSLSK